MHAAHERIVYERLKTQLEGTAIVSQPLLIPATFAATPQEVATAEACAAVLATLGLEITPFSPRTLAVRAVPGALVDGDPVELARSVLAELGLHDASTVVQRAQNELLLDHGLPRAARARIPAPDAGRNERGLRARWKLTEMVGPTQPRAPDLAATLVRRELDEGFFLRGR